MGSDAVQPIMVRLTVNGKAVSLEVQPSEALASTLRNRLRLTGTKVSCDVQVCGACTVLVDGLPRSACTYLTYEARGRQVLTVEGLAPSDDALHPLQAAFLEYNAYQCGFCTGGMLMAAQAYLTAGGDGEDDDLVETMDGNIYRCTGYLPILAAILEARSSAPDAAGPEEA